MLKNPSEKLRQELVETVRAAFLREDARDGEGATFLTDLIADIALMAHREGHDADSILTDAMMHFEAEANTDPETRWRDADDHYLHSDYDDE